MSALEGTEVCPPCFLFHPPHLTMVSPCQLVASGQTHIIFSGRREGLAIYFARLVQPIWLARVTAGGYVHSCNPTETVLEPDFVLKPQGQASIQYS